MSGRPDSLFHLPELHGIRMSYARLHVIEGDSGNDYQEYFEYVSGVCDLGQPNDWEEALELYKILL